MASLQRAPAPLFEPLAAVTTEACQVWTVMCVVTLTSSVTTVADVPTADLWALVPHGGVETKAEQHASTLPWQPVLSSFFSQSAHTSLHGSVAGTTKKCISSRSSPLDESFTLAWHTVLFVPLRFILAFFPLPACQAPPRVSPPSGSVVPADHQPGLRCAVPSRLDRGPAALPEPCLVPQEELGPATGGEAIHDDGCSFAKIHSARRPLLEGQGAHCVP